MKKERGLRIRMNEKEKKEITDNSKSFGFSNVSEFLRFLGLNVEKIELKIKEKE